MQKQHLAEEKYCSSYFSEHLPENCGNCDVCKNPPTFFDGKIIAQKALSACHRTKQKIGTNMMINILRGSANQDIYQRGFQTRLKPMGLERMSVLRIGSTTLLSY